MPHIVHINLSSAFGGGERQTANLLSYLSKQPGLQQTLITKPGNPLADLGRAAGCQVVSASNQLQVHFNQACGGADLVHCHDGRSVYWGWLHRRLTGTPYVITRRVEHALSSRWLTRQTYRNASAVICLSRAIQAQVQKIAPEQQRPLIPSACFPVPADQATVTTLRKRFAGKRLIGQIGALIDLKGQQFTLEVARKMAQTHPELHFLFLGSGPNQEALREQAEGLSNVTFEGQVQGIGSYLACMEVLLMPSLKEGFGSTILEAMHHHVPVIASEVGGIPDIIQSGKNGLLVPAANSDALRQALLQLIESPNLNQQLTAGGAGTVRMYAPEVVFSQCWELYEQLWQT
ncbi:glycosyltransferase family 4 protein [Motiliproteus sediminis]|uniref:glycosyltransferase family 4 protein n=1 Tax=Motiliproteus sediminis TaxID=1468178 RepID=UPI001AEFCAD1|nr:glycosyltransferase family 4 protein [Motiliproteus sediminis]